jgi:hypothetical protein
MAQTTVEWLIESLPQRFKNALINTCSEEIEKAKEMEKEQAIDLIKHTAMFMSASTLDEDIANMSFEDVYDSFRKKNLNK